MQIKTPQAQNIDLNDSFFVKSIAAGNQDFLSYNFVKIKLQNIKQIKLYLGFVYFGVISILSFSLFY